jgi:hypothetical protein
MVRNHYVRIALSEKSLKMIVPKDYITITETSEVLEPNRK